MAGLHTPGAPVVIGAGVAGLSSALTLAEHGSVTVVASAELEREAASAWAQGGVAAAVGEDDSAALHAQDTLAAGDGLCDLAATGRITGEGAATIARLLEIGARFDRDAQGRLKLGLEAAHSRRRIVHAQGDGTGREVLRALAHAVRAHPSITVLEGLEVRRLIQDGEGVVRGALAADASGRPAALTSDAVVLATGGLGGLYAHTTNPRGAIGAGLAMAARAGAGLRDMEFVQFHPTALDVGLDPMPLVSEAVRGEGAWLVNGSGERFMSALPRAELEPRDVVARAVWAELSAGRAVFLDARGTILGERFALAFPTITAACRAAGVDPARDLIPIRPAAHYHMGGVAADARGRTTLAGLWACGEVASTGLHGANRLASNSLLEAAVCGVAAGRDIAGRDMGRAVQARVPELPAHTTPGEVRAILDMHAGVLRTREGLLTAREALHRLTAEGRPQADAALVGLFIVEGALKREESRGAHARTDFPAKAAEARSSRQTLADLSDIRLADAA